MAIETHTSLPAQHRCLVCLMHKEEIPMCATAWKDTALLLQQQSATVPHEMEVVSKGHKSSRASTEPLRNFPLGKGGIRLHRNHKPPRHPQTCISLGNSTYSGFYLKISNTGEESPSGEQDLVIQELKMTPVTAPRGTLNTLQCTWGSKPT